MELRHLRQFLVVAHELHFGRSAEKLGIAQPTLSQQIMALEAELGVRLFDRAKRVVLLTNAGAVFLRETQTIFDQIEEASLRARAAARGQRGLLLVGASGPPIRSLLPHYIRTFSEKFPDVELSMEVMHSRGLVESLRQRHLHVALARSEIRVENVIERKLWDLPFHLILPAGHRLSDRSAVALRDLEGETLITYPRQAIEGSYDQLLAFCRGEGYEPRAVREIDGVDSIIGVVACRFGISLLPDTGHNHGPDTIAKPIALRQHTDSSLLSTSVYWNADETSPLVASLVQHLVSSPKS